MNMLRTLTCLLVLVAFETFAQEQPIEIKKVFGGVKVMQGGQVLKPKQISTIMQTNSDALAEYKKAQSSGGVAQAFGAIGGALIGWPLGTAAGGGDPNWGLAGAGVGVILLAIPFGSSSTKHLTKAVEIYNGKSGASGRLPVKMYLSPLPGGLRLQVRF